jgi:hypothetical protein
MASDKHPSMQAPTSSRGNPPKKSKTSGSRDKKSSPKDRKRVPKDENETDKGHWKSADAEPGPEGEASQEKEIRWVLKLTSTYRILQLTMEIEGRHLNSVAHQ